MGKHSAQFALSGTSWLTWDSTGPAFGLRLHHKQLRPIHLYVHIGDRWAGDDREIKLLGTPDVLLLPGLNVRSDRFGDPLDRLGSDLQIRQQVELFPTLSKRRLASNGCQHAPHAGGEIRLLDVELDVGGKLSAVAFGAQIVRAVDTCPAHSREDRSGTHALIVGRVPTSARNGSMVIVGRLKP